MPENASYLPFFKKLTPLEYSQHMILKVVAPFGSLIFAVLALYDWLLIQQYELAVISALFSFIFLVAFLYYHVTQKQIVALHIMIWTSLVLLIAFVYTNQNNHFGLAWALLVPTLTIMSLGIRWGLRTTFVVYLILLGILVDGLSVWQNPDWDITGLVRFTLTYFVSTFLVYVLSLSNNESYRELENKHIHKIAEHKQVEKISQTDSLTGVYNRHFLNQEMAQLPLDALDDQKTNIVFFIVQIDWFKPYVDYYGYQKGDELLVTVSQLIFNQMKSVNAKVFRVGGSQFAGLSIDQDITKTLSQINEIEGLLNALAIPHALSIEQQVHVSIGITIDNKFQNFNFEALYKSADKALFQAIENRNHKAIVIDERA